MIRELKNQEKILDMNHPNCIITFGITTNFSTIIVCLDDYLVDYSESDIKKNYWLIKKGDMIKCSTPEIAASYVSMGLAKEFNIIRNISKTQRYEVLKRQNWACNSCGSQLKYNKNNNWKGDVAHIDHIWPFSDYMNYPKGAEHINETENLQALCPQCNFNKKNNKIN